MRPPRSCRRLACFTTLPIVLGVAVPPGVNARPAASTPDLEARAAATPKTVATGAKAVLKQAKAFPRASKCPVRARKARYVGSVGRANRSRSTRRIVNASIFPVVTRSGKCTGVRSIASARRSGEVEPTALASYSSKVRSRLKDGTLLYRVSWRATSGRRFSTIAGVSPKGALRIDPLISSFLTPAPDSKSAPATAPRQGALPRQAPGPVTGQITWNPWGAAGRCIAVDLLGFCRVRKFVNMVIFVNVYGRIVSEAETASVVATLANAKRKVKAEIINDGKCKKFTVVTHWTSPIGRIIASMGRGGFDVNLTITGLGSSGIDEEVYILCGDGSGQVIG